MLVETSVGELSSRETRRPKDNFGMVLREIKFENGRWLKMVRIVSKEMNRRKRGSIY
jgi:hypothetical protein